MRALALFLTREPVFGAGRLSCRSATEHSARGGWMWGLDPAGGLGGALQGSRPPEARQRPAGQGRSGGVSPDFCAAYLFKVS